MDNITPTVIRLIKPTIDLKDEYFDMIAEWKNHNEKLNPWTLKLDATDFPKMIDKLEGFSKGIGLRGDQVENSTYWLVDDKRIIGAVNIRHRLNEYLLKYDGHIGGGIRPSDRNKGFATKMLSLSLEKASKIGLLRVLVTCNKDNIASEKTIIKNGGVFESEEKEENENIVRRFWIVL